MDHNLFICSSTEGHCGCFQVWVIINKAARNICVRLFVWTWVLVHLNQYQGTQLLDRIVRVCSVL